MNIKTINLQSQSSKFPVFKPATLKRWPLALLLGGGLLLGGCAEPAAEDTTAEQPIVADGSTEADVSTEVGEGGGCMDDIRANGLQVITSPDYPPYEFLNEQNEIVGYEIDLVKALADEMGVEVNITGQSFDGLIPSLLADRADMIAAGMSVTEERKKSVAFSNPYNNTKNVIVAPKDSAITGTDSLSGHTVAVQSGSLQELIAEGIEGAEVKAYGLYTDAAVAVDTGQADSMIVDQEVAAGFADAYPNLHVVEDLGAQQTAFAVQPACTDLVAELNAALATVQNNGEMERLQAQWFSPKAQAE